MKLEELVSNDCYVHCYSNIAFFLIVMISAYSFADEHNFSTAASFITTTIPMMKLTTRAGRKKFPLSIFKIRMLNTQFFSVRTPKTSARQHLFLKRTEHGVAYGLSRLQAGRPSEEILIQDVKTKLIIV